MTALEMMSDTWWLAYGDEVNAGVAGCMGKATGSEPRGNDNR